MEPICTTDGLVYVVTSKVGYYKIGTTRNIAQRMAALQTGHPETITFVAVTSEPQSEDAVYVCAWDMERAMHSLLGHARMRGEWFNVSYDELVGAWQHAIQKAKDKPSGIKRAPQKRGRKPKGDVAMTDAERQRAYRARKKTPS